MSVFDGQEKSNKPGEGQGADGRFLPGNKFWTTHRNAGRKALYDDPEDLQAACFEYFDWVDDNPLWEMKVFSNGVRMKVPHPRAMTIRGLTAFIGMAHRVWDVYRKKPEFADVCEAAEGVMYDQKFAGAAAGLFNANIIARDLGLSDKKEIDGDLTVEIVDSFSEGE